MSDAKIILCRPVTRLKCRARACAQALRDALGTVLDLLYAATEFRLKSSGVKVRSDTLYAAQLSSKSWVVGQREWALLLGLRECRSLNAKTS